jgi:aspartate aminotransferase-like enzyme
MAGRETLLLTDVVSYLAGGPVDFDEHRLDFALAGTQKALALPPGLTVFCASERYLQRAASVPRRGYHLDPLRVIEGHRARKTPSTPAISLLYALARQLEDVSAGATLPAGGPAVAGAEAWRARFEVHERMRASTAAWAARHGLELLPAPELASPTVSCVRAGGLDVRALIAGLKERGHEIGNGYGDLKDVTFRIGHMGDHTQAGLAELLALADEVLG